MSVSFFFSMAQKWPPYLNYIFSHAHLLYFSGKIFCFNVFHIIFTLSINPHHPFIALIHFRKSPSWRICVAILCADDARFAKLSRYNCRMACYSAFVRYDAASFLHKAGTKVEGCLGEIIISPFNFCDLFFSIYNFNSAFYIALVADFTF